MQKITIFIIFDKFYISSAQLTTPQRQKYNETTAEPFAESTIKEFGL